MNKWNNGKYILLKGFAKQVCDFKHFNQNLENSVVTNHVNGAGGTITSILLHRDAPIMDLLRQRKNDIEQMVAKRFNLEPLEMVYSGNLMKYGASHNGGIPLHNDWYDTNETHHPDAVVARGVLSINPTYVFGTEAYSDFDYESHTGTFGGYPGDLFIFKCSPDSWHSVGCKKQRHVDRYSINMMFKVKQK